ncbi:hypothetical protein [Pleionea mediterranea]|uniref:Uncharacterized protein n=1 Tax=Pleionea mediterranea TaxID=523701 RepID=A0A316FMB4_9GAMM|nr:hypothetical protein [Pleionea mediterranea]PWK49864.1 hypothetical protein C8D97_10725 [Pleionea mediterranea]
MFNNDILKVPTLEEIESTETFTAIRFLLQMKGQVVPSWIHQAADSAYGRPGLQAEGNQILNELMDTIDCQKLQEKPVIPLKINQLSKRACNA